MRSVRVDALHMQRNAAPTRLAFVILMIMALVSLAVPGAAAETSVTDLPLEDGGSLRLLYGGLENPRAAVIMLPGGNGMVEIGTDGSIRRMGESFLLRTLPLWRAQGFGVAVMTPPNGMSLLGHRHTAAYAATIGQVVDFIRGRTDAPIWIVGVSQGAIAAIGAGARLGRKINGIVIASSATGRSSSGETLFDSEPELVGVPTLIVANSGDTCPVSPPGDALNIAAALTRTPRKEVIYMESSAIKGQFCESDSPHSYFGIEAATIERISQWVDGIAREQPTTSR